MKKILAAVLLMLVIQFTALQTFARTDKTYECSENGVTGRIVLLGNDGFIAEQIVIPGMDTDKMLSMSKAGRCRLVAQKEVIHQEYKCEYSGGSCTITTGPEVDGAVCFGKTPGADAAKADVRNGKCKFMGNN